MSRKDINFFYKFPGYMNIIIESQKLKIKNALDPEHFLFQTGRY